MMDALQTAFAFDIHMRRDVDEKLNATGIEVESHDVAEGVVFDEDGLKVTAFLVDHGPVTPALGYRVDYRGRSVALSGDTRSSDNLVQIRDRRRTSSFTRRSTRWHCGRGRQAGRDRARDCHHTTGGRRDLRPRPPSPGGVLARAPLRCAHRADQERMRGRSSRRRTCWSFDVGEQIVVCPAVVKP